MSIEQLASQILYHKSLYYRGKSIITDAEYDALEDELRHRDPAHPVLSRVGFDIEKEGGPKIRHATPMLSLLKTYDTSDLLDFLIKYSCVACDKLDGMALSLRYDARGYLKAAATRGNGEWGEDVTHKIFHIIHIPQKVSFFSSGDNNFKNYTLEVRGEVYFPLSEFGQFEERFDSFRNAVPGTMTRKDIEGCRDVLNVLRFCPYEVIVYDAHGKRVESSVWTKQLSLSNDYKVKLEYLGECGFTLPKQMLHDVPVQDVAHPEVLEGFLETLFHKHRDYHIDGLVFRVRSEEQWEALGFTSHHPRGSLAYKVAGETAQTTILDIEQNMGRSGKVTFRARLEPVFLSGAKISYATLHNAEYIESGNYAPGARVEVIRSGEVIPAIVRCIEEAPKPYVLPERCPCGYALLRQGPDLMCVQTVPCPPKDQESLVHFVSALEMNGVSDKIVYKMRAAGLVQEPADFFKLKEEDLLQLEGFAQKSAQNVIATIQNSRRIPLGMFLTALGLKRGGVVKCKEVARKFKTLARVLALKTEDLLAEKGWAEKSAEDFVSSLHAKQNIIANLLSYVEVLSDHSEADVAQKEAHPYFGKHICITGALSRPREEYKKALEAVGGKLVSAVSSKTAFLVCNEASSSSKYKEAQALGISIVSEEQFAAALF